MPSNVVYGIDADSQKAIQKLSKVVAKLEESNQKLRQMNRAGQQVSKTTGGITESLGGVAQGLIGAGGVYAAVRQVQQAWENWRDITLEQSSAARKAADEMIALAALQEGGTKAARVREAAAVAAGYGITERGAAFNAAQALQSAQQAIHPEWTAKQAWEAGIAQLKTVYAAVQAGVPVEAALEAEIQGAAQRMAPGEMVRKLYVAGEQSSRTPALLAQGAPAMMFWADKDVGAAVAAELAAPYEKELKVYLRRAAQGLSMTEGGARWYKRHGVGEGATPMERLHKLYEEGMFTREQLVEEVGIKEERQLNALMALIPNYEAIARRVGIIQEQAKPGLLAGKRAGVEAELPTARSAREIAVLESMYENELALGEQAQEALDYERKERIRGLAFKQMGITQDAFGRKIGEGGKATAWDTVQFFLSGIIDKMGWHGGTGYPDLLDLKENMGRIEKHLESLNQHEERKAAERAQPAPVGVSPYPDR